MAKGRSHGGSDRHERLLGTISYGHGSTDQPDLSEDDVWSLGTGDNDNWSTGRSSGRSRVDEDAPGQTREWRKKNHFVGGLSSAFEGRTPSSVIHQFHSVDSSVSSHYAMASSVPTNIPDWHKILRVDSTESLPYSTGSQSSSAEDDCEWIPPHEYLAREHALRGKMVAPSVFEGVGRTLKGRDMSRVRDAVWSRTGFSG